MFIDSQSRKSQIFWPVAIVFLAACLRLLGLDHLPPGLFFDESANGIDALRVLEGTRPIFFTGNQGREPLLIYLQALTIALIGPSPLALRLPSAFIGILTVAATYTTFRSLFDQRVGIIGAFLLATLFWHIQLSHLALRAVGLPLFATLAGFWFGKGLRSGRALPFALAGLFLGLDLYTYIPSRLVPLLFGLWLLGCLAIPTWRVVPARQLLRGGLIAAVIFVATVAPLARYWAHHPQDFLGRIEAEGGRASRGPLDGLVASAQAFTLEGDPNPRHNLPGRPLLGLALTALGAFGLLATHCRRRSADAFLLIWIGVMLAPAALSAEPDHALRLVGELPFLLALPALGLGWLSRLRPFAARRVAPAAVGLILALFAAQSGWDYFRIWANRPDVADSFQAEQLGALRLLDQAPTGQTTFVAGEVYEDRSIPLSLIGSIDPTVRSFAGRDAFVIPYGIGPINYIYPRTARPAAGIPLRGAMTVLGETQDRFGRIEGELIQFPSPHLPPPQRPSEALIGSAVAVSGVDLAPIAQPGQPLAVALHWMVRGGLPPGRWEFLAHLVRRSDHRLLAEDYNFGFPSPQWREGDQIISWFSLPVPTDAPAGIADVQIALFDRDSGQHLAVSQPNGAPAGDTITIGPVRLDHPIPIPAPKHPLALRFGDSIQLQGYDLSRSDDGSLTLRLHWRTDAAIGQDYTVFAHRLDREGKFLVAADSEPAGGEFPTSTWAPDEAVLDTHILPPAAGSDRIEVGIYLLSTGERLPIIDTTHGKPQGDAVILPEVPE